ncbi:hypothetical protein RN001_007567 [Aquatica leii]|uniref:Uncharacterized protein n=1 Tax=Aquatica leii TaxID=1421715 RepID=A0AAN7S961_9COLE|nr:hypothetical protein RN001_007567 [Aquatica leii]
MANQIIIVGVLTFATYISAARILGIAPTPSHSHQVVLQPIWRELSLRGHELVVVTTDPINDSSLTNLKEIDLHSVSYNIWNENILSVIDAWQHSAFKGLYVIIQSTFKVAEMQFQHKEVQTLIKNQTEHFDLVIVEFLLPIYYAFAEHFKCPFIGVTTMDPPPFVFNFVGNPNHPAITRDAQFAYNEEPNLFQRVLATFSSLFAELVTDMLFSAQQQSIVTKYFGKEMPHLHTIARNVSLLFLNTEPIFHPMRMLVPSVIQIGGNIHGGLIKPLPKDLKEFLDNATNGFIYFSLGSNVKSKDVPIEIRNVILNTFAELPFRIVWKFEIDNLPNKSDNIFISKWMPQESVLNHPNIKVFITQGGLQSMEEAIYSFVPMIGVPFFADQYHNVQTMVRKGMGLSIDYKSINKHDFKNKIMEVIQDSRYKDKVTEIGTLIKDQPMTGLEKVVWWTEYVLRHKEIKTNMANKIIIVGVLTFVTYISAARILGIAPTPSHSHQSVLQQIWRELSLRGHELVVLTTDPINDSSLTNLTEIDLHSVSYNIWNENILSVIDAWQQSVFKGIYVITQSTFKVAEMQFQHTEVQNLIKNETEHFDLVIVEFLLPIYYAFAEHFKCPFIGVTTMDPPPFAFNFVGNPNHPAITRDAQFAYNEEPNLFQRVLATFSSFFAELVTDILFSAQQQSIVTKYFGKEMPHLHTIARNVSLLFLNTEPIFHPIRMLVPSVIQIGGNIHGGLIKPLPKDLKEFLDNATNGFIYFSLGSNVKSKDVPIEMRNVILDTFAELPFQIVWKFELDNLPNKSDNIFISKWMPQESVLNHPNIKVFITQGGLQSMEEAIYSFVPMIGVPFFADQYHNVQKMVKKGMGLSIDYKSINKDDFKNKIMEVIQDSRYKDKVTEIGTLIKDQPMTGLEKVVWWTDASLCSKLLNNVISLNLIKYGHLSS